MREFLRDLRSHESAITPEVSEILGAGFVEENGCVLLASRAHHAASTRAATEDETGYECFVNHIHLRSLQEALEVTRQLTKGLAEHFTGGFVVIVSFDGREATVRFHRFRVGQTWLRVARSFEIFMTQLEKVRRRSYVIDSHFTRK
jgi:hypothetical protein